MDLFHFFQGSWAFERSISDSPTGQPHGTAEGKALFSATAAAATLLYREEGKLSVGPAAETHSFFRHYRYHFDQDTMQVYFADEVTGNTALYQSYHYHADRRLLLPTAEHHCSQDLYNGQYSLLSEDVFSSSTVVLGPHKNYTIRTTFIRLKPESGRP